MSWYWWIGLVILWAIADYTWFRYFWDEKPTPGPWICPECLAKNDQRVAVCELCEKPRPRVA